MKSRTARTVSQRLSRLHVKIYLWSDGLCSRKVPLHLSQKNKQLCSQKKKADDYQCPCLNNSERAEANQLERQIVTTFYVKTLAIYFFLCPRTQFFTDNGIFTDTIGVGTCSCHTGTYDTRGFFAKSYSKCCCACSYINRRMNLKYLTLATPPNCGRQVVFRYLFVVFSGWIRDVKLEWVGFQTPLSCRDRPLEGCKHAHTVYTHFLFK